MPRARMTVCSVPGCPEYTDQGRCADCRRRAERIRGKTAERGYAGKHVTRFRRGVLDRDPLCVLCRQAPAVHADHHPLSRRELVAQGLDPNDPQHGRGLCGPCHSKETAANPDQIGGWAAQ